MIFLALGSNLGNRQENLELAIAQLQEKGVETVNRSSFYETDAWGNTEQESFINMVIAVKTHFSPLQLLDICLKTEAELGRIRREKWGPRLIDIDIILFHDLIFDSDQLAIPHPLFTSRKFVLEPLAEIARNEIDPKTKKSIAELNRQCADNLSVKKFL